jgi:hypothetical protein
MRPNLTQVRIPLSFETGALGLVLDGGGGVRVVDAVEAAGGQALFPEGALPGGDYVLRVVLPRRGVELVEDVQELARVRPVDGVGDQVLEGVAHGPRLGVAGVEEHQHQVGQVDDVIGDAQRRRALGVGVEAGGVDQDLSPQPLAGAGLELQIGVDALAFAGGHQVDILGDLVEGEARVRVERDPGQGVTRRRAAVADNGKPVVHRLVAGALKRLTEEVIDEGGFAGGKGTENGDQGPPGDLGGEGLVSFQQPHAVGDPVQGAKALNRAQEDGVLLFQVSFQVLQPLLDDVCGRAHRKVPFTS